MNTTTMITSRHRVLDYYHKGWTTSKIEAVTNVYESAVKKYIAEHKASFPGCMSCKAL